MILVFYGRPISKKNSRVLFKRKGRFFSFPSDAFKRFQKEAVAEAKKVKAELHAKTMTGPVGIKFIFQQKGRMRQDIDNAISGVLDVLQEAKIIEDDNQVVDIKAEKWGGGPVWTTNVVIEEVRVVDNPNFPPAKITAVG